MKKITHEQMKAIVRSVTLIRRGKYKEAIKVVLKYSTATVEEAISIVREGGQALRKKVRDDRRKTIQYKLKVRNNKRGSLHLKSGDRVIIHYAGETMKGKIEAIGYCYEGEHMVKADNGRVLFLSERVGNEQILEKEVNYGTESR